MVSSISCVTVGQKSIAQAAVRRDTWKRKEKTTPFGVSLIEAKAV